MSLPKSREFLRGLADLPTEALGEQGTGTDLACQLPGKFHVI